MPDPLILLTTLGGLAMVATVFLPGQSTGWRVLSAVLGAVLLVWMGWVLVTDGTYGLSPYFAFVPLLIIGQSLRTVLRARREEGSAATPAHEGAAVEWHHVDERYDPHGRPAFEDGTPGHERPGPPPQ